jgi:hypothetical protein
MCVSRDAEVHRVSDQDHHYGAATTVPLLEDGPLVINATGVDRLG